MISPTSSNENSSSAPSTSSSAVRRLTRDLKQLVDDPVPNCLAIPLPSNILEWHYVILGAEDTPYEGFCDRKNLILNLIFCGILFSLQNWAEKIFLQTN